MEGIHSLGCADYGEEILWIGTWVLVFCVLRVDSERDGSPCGLVASSQGWSVLISGKTMPMAGRFILRIQ